MSFSPRWSALELIQRKSQQMQQGYLAGWDVAVPSLRPRGVAMTASGRSAAASLMVHDAASLVLDIPMNILPHARLPNYVDSTWHMLAVGDGQEPLALARDADRRGCDVTAFGVADHAPASAHRSVARAADCPPRMGIAHTWFSMLGFLQGSGVLPQEVPLERAVAAVREVDAACAPAVRQQHNPAKQIARLVHRQIPRIHAAPAFTGVGVLFASLLDDRAKTIAHLDGIPESDPAALAAWRADPNHDRFAALVLSDRSQHEALSERIAFMRERYTGARVPWHHQEFDAIEDFADHTVQQARAVQLLDYVSYYAAFLRGVDPDPVDPAVALNDVVAARLTASDEGFGAKAA